MIILQKSAVFHRVGQGISLVGLVAILSFWTEAAKAQSGPIISIPQPCFSTNGETVTLFVKTWGTPSSYQWFLNNAPLQDGPNIQGASSNLLTILSFSPNEAGAYEVEVPGVGRKAAAYLTNPPGPGIIQTKINAAAPGDTIVLPGGTFFETLVVDKHLTLVAEIPRATVVDGGICGPTFLVPSNVVATFRGIIFQDGVSPHYQLPRGGYNVVPGMENFGHLSMFDCVIRTPHGSGPGHQGGLANFGTMVMSNCVVTNIGTFSWATLPSSAVANRGSLTVQECVIKNNRGTEAGGILNLGQLVVEDSEFTDNQSWTWAGAIASPTHAVATELTIHRCRFDNNTGAIFSDDPFSVSDSFFSNNIWGGAIRGSSLCMTNSLVVSSSGLHESAVQLTGTCIVDRCTIAYNRVYDAGGAGLRFEGGSLLLLNSTLSSNVAGAFHYDSGFGGGLWVRRGTVTASHCTIVGNNGGIGSGGVYVSSGDFSTYNSIIAGNTSVGQIAGDCQGLVRSLGHNLIQNTNGCTLVQEGTGDLYGQDPLLAPLFGDSTCLLTHALRAGSPAIDAGPAANYSLTDGRGLPRPIDGSNDGVALPDIGAFESQSPPPARVTALNRMVEAVLQIAFRGFAGRRYQLETSPSLHPAEWTPQSVRTTDANGYFGYEFPNPRGGATAGFVRAVLLAD